MRRARSGRAVSRCRAWATTQLQSGNILEKGTYAGGSFTLSLVSFTVRGTNSFTYGRSGTSNYATGTTGTIGQGSTALGSNSSTGSGSNGSISIDSANV